MNLSLSGNTQPNMNITQQAVQSAAATTAASPAAETGGTGSQGYMTGQVFSGEVAEINGKDILLLLGNHQTMSARLDGDISLVLGQNVYFEVKSNSNHQISLRPLYTNLNGTDPSVLKALDAAGLQVNEKTVMMTSSMMEEGMSINKNALQAMFRQINANQNVSPQTIVQMTKLGLPITELNVTQFENYKNLEHQILNDINTLTDGLPELAGKLVTEGNMTDAAGFSKELLNMLLDSMPEEQSGDTNRNTAEIQNNTQDTLQELNQDTAAASRADKMSSTLQELSPEQKESLANQLEQLGLKPEMKSQLLSGEMSDRQLMEFIKTTLEQPGAQQSEQISKLLQGNEYQTLLKNILSQQLLLKPEDVAREGRVEELYERMSEQSQKITQMLQNISKSTPELSKSAGNMQDNLNFMNQMNQMLTYVQLPLKMAHENANGDLYVYTNKKNLAAKDGNISALLHLDMEHLGTMDIHVAMQQNKVSTHFYMQKEEMLDFIEANIRILNERLTKKGYSMKTTVTMKEKDEQEKGIVDEFLKKNGEAPIHAGAPMKFSFDVRA
ncbi:MAG: flagellar hook-length control protein FliK [bacterium]|nr:flagellar hook-length control protein FliK [bacterium]